MLKWSGKECLKPLVINGEFKLTESDAETIASLLDIFWQPYVLERLVKAWGLEPDNALKALGWMVALIVDAVKQGKRPGIYLQPQDPSTPKAPA